jgi:hypothetical protein
MDDSAKNYRSLNDLELGMSIERILSLVIGCSETASIRSEILKGDFLAREIGPAFTIPEMADIIYSELNFWTSSENNDQVLVKRPGSNFEADSTTVEKLYRSTIRR